jgi:hypothetical protein
MYLKNRLLTGTILIWAVSLLVISTSCSSEKKKEVKEANLENFDISKDVLNDISTAKKIFYSLPSPLETAMIIKSAGAEYQERLLNPTENAGNYTTNKSIALNLGIYTTDMSFASLFDQTQTTINYMDASKTLADGLGILDAIDEDVMARLEDNINNRDAIMDIISETFLNTSSYLKENDREAIATVVLVGGWIEGLYIATQLVEDDNIEGNRLVDRVIEQKLSFEILEKLLEQSKEDENIQSLSAQLKDLKDAFNEITIVSSEVSPEPNEVTNITTLKSDVELNFTPEIFKSLKEKVRILRSNFIL